MKVPAPLRLGCVKYLNAQPLIHGWEGPVEFDHPSSLCHRLARGELDVALVSSFEFLRNPTYSIVDRISIASDGAVYSVILAHAGPIAALREIVADPASQTSVHLLQCLLAEQFKVAPRFVRQGDLSESRAQLLIGDQAIRFRRQFANQFEFLDLGAAWKNFSGLPFVYALWLIHPAFQQKKAVARALRCLAEENLRYLDAVIAAQPARERAFCEFYYRNYLRFHFGADEKQGLRMFGDLCLKHELIPQQPDALNLV